MALGGERVNRVGYGLFLRCPRGQSQAHDLVEVQERGLLGGVGEIVGYELPAQGEDARHVEVVLDALFELGYVAVVGF